MINEKIIAAVRTQSEFNMALGSECNVIFLLSSSILTLGEMLKKCHELNKKLFVHIDLTEGIGKDKAGIKLLKKMNIDGIISTRTNLIKFAKEEGIYTVQRFFVVDSKSLSTTVEAALQSKCDVIEIMPGILPKVIKYLTNELDIPVLAGGLIETEEEIISAVSNGALTVSTGKSEFWGR